MTTTIKKERFRALFYLYPEQTWDGLRLGTKDGANEGEPGSRNFVSGGEQNIRDHNYFRLGIENLLSLKLILRKF